jgi:hypothetical protein
MSSFRKPTSTQNLLKSKIDDMIEFPELFYKNETTKSTSSLNFLEASQKPMESIVKEGGVKPGWVELTIDKETNSIVTQKNKHLLDDNNMFQDEVNRAILSLALCWERYKKNFEELNGEDSYQYIYSNYFIDDEQDDSIDE